ETYKLLERERARADRSHDPLAVVAFASRCLTNGRADLAAIVPVLRGRIRSTDDIGWLDGRQLCAVLPGTTMEGARKVAEDVCLALPEDVPTPVCTMFVYPSGPSGGEEAAPAPAEPERANVQSEPQPVTLEVLLARPMPLWKRTIDVIGA